jgi:hypothetical protein
MANRVLGEMKDVDIFEDEKNLHRKRTLIKSLLLFSLHLHLHLHPFSKHFNRYKVGKKENWIFRLSKPHTMRNEREKKEVLCSFFIQLVKEVSELVNIIVL